VCELQVKLCDPLVTHGPYLSAVAVVLPIIRRYTNNQIIITLTNWSGLCDYLNTFVYSYLLYGI